MILAEIANCSFNIETWHAFNAKSAPHMRDWPSAAAEWAKPSRSAAALRSKGTRACGITFTPILRKWLTLTPDAHMEYA